MTKNTIVIFFSVLLLGFIAAPTIIASIDDSVDISIFYNNVAEEEEVNKIKLPFSNDSHEPADLTFLTSEVRTAYFLKNYPNPHLNLFSPPPEIG
ncbi:hypothetical protein PW52_03065 [Tamlana sedimentorum]|uniref:Uncharacterized protein n=1 Tax=Neotamlana sedimentorum TaxID=1435349 RepID=A0A0D7WBY9_9FLAO|nr:hypothetical protein [Tamlana sedimentorum]KJD36641.1 hypothetical protein PW52_03065 [Tamlana sedimentorum]